MPREMTPGKVTQAKVVRGKTLVATIGLGLAAGGLVLGPSFYAAHVARAAFAEQAGLSVGDIVVDPFHDTVTLRDVVVARGSLHVYARRLTVPLRTADWGIVSSAAAQDASERRRRVAQTPIVDAPNAPAPASPAQSDGSPKGPVPTTAAAAPGAIQGTPAGSASASDVTIVLGPTTYSAKKIDMAGTSLTSGDLAALLDPTTTDDLDGRLRKVNAASITIIEAAVESGPPTGRSRLSVPQMTLADVGAGRIGAANAAGSLASSVGADTSPILKTGPIEAKGLDVLTMAHLISAVRTDDAEPLRSVADALTIHEVSVVNKEDQGALTIASISQQGLKARPLKIDVRTMTVPADKDVLEGDAAQTNRWRAVLNDIVGSYQFDAFTVEKAAFASTKKPGPTALEVGRIELRDLRDRKLGAATLREFALAQPATRISLATLDFANLALPAPGAKGSEADGPSSTALPSLGTAAIGQLDVDVATPQDDGSVSTVRFKLAHLETAGERDGGGLLKQGTLSLENLTFDLPDSESSGMRELYAMGYRHLDLSAAVASRYDAAQETLAVEKCLVSGVDMGSFDIAVDFGNVNKTILSGNPAVAKASALAMLLKRVEIHIANKGLFEKVLDWRAKEDGKTTAEERDAGIDLFADKLPLALGNSPGVQAIGAAVAQFITDPKTLHISVADKEGLGAADIGLIGSPDALFRRLDIAADANH